MKYTRELLKDVEGYVPGEQPKGGNVIKLNTNENPYPPSPKVLEALRALDTEALRKYPDPLSKAFREAYAKRHDYPNADWVIAGNGMDELLALALRTFTDPGDAVLTAYPTYSLYEILAQLHGVEIVHVDLDDNFLLPEDFYATSARICLLTRPNAPTGVSVPRAAAERLCKEFDGIVVIDEAYVDFADDSCVDFPKRFENAIVMRTFSKSFSLAGMRIGAAIAQPEVIAEFLKTKDSYNLNVFSQTAALAALEDYDYMNALATKVRATRETLRDALQERGFDVAKSQTNFLLAQWNGAPSAREIFNALNEARILVRYFDARRLKNALRITIGTKEECQALLTELDRILEL
jgi:histidinol-phosphate aminotransferase